MFILVFPFLGRQSLSMCIFKKSNTSDLMPSGGWQMTHDIKSTDEEYQAGHDQTLMYAKAA